MTSVNTVERNAKLQIYGNRRKASVLCNKFLPGHESADFCVHNTVASFKDKRLSKSATSLIGVPNLVLSRILLAFSQSSAVFDLRLMSLPDA